VQEIIKIMGPATFSSGMMQINVWTNLFFASFIPNAAAAVSAMGYAGLLVQTPLGILSNMILVPLMPVFARLAAPENWSDLKLRIRQGLLMSAVTMLPLSALMIVLAVPISRVVYERYAFKVEDSYLTAAVLIAFSVGMFAYLGRDILVRVFYALGDGDTPFRISIANIFLNALLAYLLVKPLGAPGLVLATVVVNIVSMVIMMWLLHQRLNGLPLWEWTLPVIWLTIASLVAGFASWAALQQTESWLAAKGLGGLLLQLAIAGGVGTAVYILLVLQLKLPEVDLFTAKIKQKLIRR
jgi:putative peptidoglycan lipid II flippase